MAGMHWPSFLLWNALGGIGWAIFFGLLGYFGGEAAAELVARAGVGVAVAAGVVALAAWLFVHRRRRRCEGRGGSRGRSCSRSPAGCGGDDGPSQRRSPEVAASKCASRARRSTYGGPDPEAVHLLWGWDVSPPLAIRDTPRTGARELALRGRGPRRHRFDSLDAAAEYRRTRPLTRDGAGVPAGAVQTANGSATASWGGPCPPEGDGPHRYVFAVYALDAPLGLGGDASADEVRDALAEARAGARHAHGQVRPLKAPRASGSARIRASRMLAA